MFDILIPYFKCQFYFAIIYITINILGFDLYIQKFFIALLNDFFKYINRNESLFFTKRRKPISHGNTSEKSTETIKFDGYSLKEINDCFTEKEPEIWNLLKPSWEPKNSEYEYELNNLGMLLYLCGLIVRLSLLLPNRLIILIIIIISTYGGCIVTESLAVWFPESKIVFKIRNFFVNLGFKLLGVSMYLHCIHHRKGNDKPRGGIGISNHTGPADIPVLRTFCDYGFMFSSKKGFLIDPTYRTLYLTGNYVGYEPTDDPNDVKRRTVDRAKRTDLYPLMIFAEGTCTSADTITRFKKGPFELGCTIYPIAIKYNQLYCSPFWDSRSKGFIAFCLSSFTNWSTVVDVYHMQPVTRKESETGIQFAARVQDLIANRIGLKQVNIDGIKVKHGKLKV